MEVKGGSLFASADGGAAGTTSTIGCQLTVSGDTTIRILTKIGTLKITKDFYWLGGTWQATVDCAAGGGADQIVVDDGQGKGKLFVGGSATVQVFAINYNPNNGLGAGFRRKLLSARSGIFNVVPNMAPSLTLVNPNAPTFQLNLVDGMNGRRWYELAPAPGQN